MLLYPDQLDKVRKKANIGNRYNQLPHLARDTIWESGKTTKKTPNTGEPRYQPFQAGDHKAERNRQDIMTNTNKINKINKNERQKKHRIGQYCTKMGSKVMPPVSTANSGREDRIDALYVFSILTPFNRYINYTM